MNKKTLKRHKAFLKYFGIPTDKEVIYLTDGGNSVIANTDTKWKEFLGYSINSVSERYAKAVNKPTEWI